MALLIKHLPQPVAKSYRTQSLGTFLTVGAYSYGAEFYVHWEGESSHVSIGRYCSIAQNVRFFAGQEHNLDWGTTYPFTVFPVDWSELRQLKGHPLSRGNIDVGNDVWIGYGALIRSGVSLGDGAAVGMGAVVTRDVPPYAVVAGNPARVVRYRFPPEIIDELLKLRWWTLPDEEVRRIAPILCRPLDRAALDALIDVLGR